MRKNLLLASALSIPVLLFFAAYWFNHSSGIEPTGFIQYDNVSYIAYAKQYTEQGNAHLQYSNPFNDGNGYAPVYFQVQTVFFALLLKAGIPIALILPLFTIISAFICFLLIIGIYDHLASPGRNRVLHIWLFAWGGGLLILAGVVFHFLYRPSAPLTEDLFTIDPEGGWWGLNLGRSLFFSCEAYYHALFLSCIFFILKTRWIVALFFMLLLSLSHPFTGIELALIICFWLVVEVVINRKSIPAWFIAGALLVTTFHIYYYLFYLEQFPDHKSVSQQYALTWGLKYYRMIPAYAIVGALALGSIYISSFKTFFQSAHNRLFLCWFIAAFLLANHEVFISARQPIHFTRGYIWTSLFLLGLPYLQHFINMLTSKRKLAILAAFVFIFLLDNFLWISLHAASRAEHPGTAYITQEQKEVFNFINERSDNNTLLVSNHNDMAYLSAVYTSVYPLDSHPYTTPFTGKKKSIQAELLSKGIVDSSLKGRDVIFIADKSDVQAIQSMQSLSAQELLRTESYYVFRKTF